MYSLPLNLFLSRSQRCRWLIYLYLAASATTALVITTNLILNAAVCLVGCLSMFLAHFDDASTSATIGVRHAVVKVSGVRGAQPLHRFEPPCNSMSPLIEPIKCYFMPK